MQFPATSPVLLFPGQGLQYVGMGRSLAQSHPRARLVFEEADDTLGFHLSRTAWDGPGDELTRTRNAQPAILAHSIAAWTVLSERLDAPPGAAAGHSLGEWSALVVAGAITFRDAVRLVHQRGIFMEDATPVGLGGMVAILGLELDAVEIICAEAAEGEVLSVATHNGPGHHVIAGHRSALTRASALAIARGASAAQDVQVSTPFHCALMHEASARLAEALADVQLRHPTLPVRSTVADCWVGVEGHGDADVRRLLVDQVTGPVLWRQAVEALAAAGATRAYAVGPGKPLVGMTKRITRRMPVHLAAEVSDLTVA